MPRLGASGYTHDLMVHLFVLHQCLPLESELEGVSNVRFERLLEARPSRMLTSSVYPDSRPRHDRICF